MLTDGTGGNPNGPGSSGDSLLEELNRDEESQENTIVDDDINTDDKQAWINAQKYAIFVSIVLEMIGGHTSSCTSYHFLGTLYFYILCIYFL